MNTVTRAFLRYLTRRRALSTLQLLGIAVGVASAVGMALSARTALDSFGRAVRFLQGQASHSLTRPAGPLDEQLLTRVMADPAVRAFSPVIDRRVELEDGTRVRVLGVDPFLDRAFRPDLEPAGGNLEEFLFEPRGVFAGAALAQRLASSSPGDAAEMYPVNSSHGPFQVLGTFPNPSGQPLFLLDIGHAQRVFDLAGKVDRVDLILDDPQGFLQRWHEGFEVRSSGQRRSAREQMLRAFRLNLEALSLLGLFVGVFLVYNTAMFAVVSRKRDAGVLLSLGAGRGEIATAFLTEFLLLGGLGGLLGAVLGYFLSGFLTGLLGQTISSLYFFLTPAAPQWHWGLAAAGVLLGWAACLLGGAYPLLELLRTDPVFALRGRVASRASSSRAKSVALVGVGVLALSMALFPPASLHVYAGFAGAFGLLLGFSLLCGAVVDRACVPLQRAWQLLAGLSGRIAAGNIRSNLGRTAVAVAAFTVALSMAVGLGLMIGSFRHTMVWWMEGQLTGEVYIAPSAEVTIPEAFYRQVLELGGSSGGTPLGVDPYRNEQILFRSTPVYLSSVSAATLQRYAAFGWKEGGQASWDEVQDGAVLVSESFQRRFAVGRGDHLELAGADGPVQLPVAGVFYDYTTEHGLIMLDRATYLRVYRDPTIDSLGLFVDPHNPDHPRQLREAVRLAREQGLPVVPREQLHGNILQVFDATFAVTRSMRVLGVVVAFFGIAGALLTLYLERQREFGIYRALGFSTAQVARMTLLEGLGMGVISLLLSAGIGTILSLVLIRVINLQSFHWTIFFHFDPGPYLTAAATAAVASSGAALYPIWKVYRTYPQMQIREE